MRRQSLVQILQSKLSDDLLLPRWRRKKERLGITSRTFGHCYVATEALWYLWAQDKGWQPRVMTIHNGRGNKKTTHWFLAKGYGFYRGEVLDPTIAQFGGIGLTYQMGRHASFLTKGPSKRCRILLRRILQSEQYLTWKMLPARERLIRQE